MEKRIFRQAEFTLEQLAQFNGMNGQPAYVAVNKIIYDVTNLPQWQGATHFRLLAGKDLSREFVGCHDANSQILNSLPKIGVMV